ncbi:cobalamin biosynthesis protein [Lichenifustis flavocetrariae]|uniref:Cobalamin biosynthesis protein n=1 Tax=Lichenifustis flavocetrariae TaxID=2949735 RepID=A0AA41YXZ6_9HYPH|nr:cobalamin biosynthesis protein [Lichenifustis flavocetrariae]MCW6510641.1 cobalamin biosynthesis protein [Lichenifustis flavocetrariae]
MALGETVSGRLAIGVGCRRECSAATIVALVTETCTGLDRTDARLFTLEAKHAEPGLHEAAALLDLPMIFLPLGALNAALPGVSIRSARVEQAVGVASVAEAAALAGAGAGARLLVSRRVSAGATCAIARSMDDDPA